MCEPGEESCLQCKKAKRQCHSFASPRSVVEFLPRNAQIELQTTKISKRKAVIAAPRATNGEGNEDCWKIDEPMEEVFTLQQDVSYGTSSTIYFTALREGH
jgi:hypothetical protein